MLVLNIVLALFILLELSNVLALYFSPTLKQANAVGVFKAWDKSKKDSDIHNLIKYLIFWVAGSKIIFLALLIVVLFFADPTIKIFATLALVLSISSFYYKMYPLIKQMDKNNELDPKGYSRKLGIMIFSFMVILLFGSLLAILN